MQNIFYSYSISIENSLLEAISLIAIIFAIYTITSKNPIMSVLFLIGLFVTISLYLIFSGLQFIGFSYLIIYIGAISILFIFILMLINIRVSELLTETNNSMFLAILIILFFNISLNNTIPYSFVDAINNGIYIFFYSVQYYTIKIFHNEWETALANISHISSIGNILYSEFFILFFMLAFILLLAMIGTIIISMNNSSHKTDLLFSSVFYSLKLNKFTNYFIMLFNDKTLFLVLYISSVIFTYYMCVNDIYTFIFFFILVCMSSLTTYFIFTNDKKERVPFFKTVKSILMFFLKHKILFFIWFPCFYSLVRFTKALGYNLLDIEYTWCYIPCIFFIYIAFVIPYSYLSMKIFTFYWNITKKKYNKENYSLRVACNNVSTYNIFHFLCFLLALLSAKTTFPWFLLNSSYILYMNPNPELVTEPTDNIVTSSMIEHWAPRLVGTTDVQPNNWMDLILYTRWPIGSYFLLPSIGTLTNEQNSRFYLMPNVPLDLRTRKLLMDFYFKDQNGNLKLQGYILTHPIRHDLVIPASRSQPMDIVRTVTRVPTSSNSYVSIMLEVVQPTGKSYSYRGFFLSLSTNSLWWGEGRYMTRPARAYEMKLERDSRDYESMASKYNELLREGKLQGFTSDPSEYDRNLTRIYHTDLERYFVSSVVGNDNDINFCSKQAELTAKIRDLDVPLTKYENSLNEVTE